MSENEIYGGEPRPADGDMGLHPEEIDAITRNSRGEVGDWQSGWYILPFGVFSVVMFGIGMALHSSALAALLVILAIAMAITAILFAGAYVQAELTKSNGRKALGAGAVAAVSAAMVCAYLAKALQ